MYILVEQWTPKTKWLQASAEERGAFMQGVGGAMVELSKLGVETLAWSLNDPDTSHRADWNYFAVWKFPSLEASHAFENAVEQSGWYDYFEHKNMRGKWETPEAVIGQHMAL